ncbi:MAG: hypothetical protein ACI89J_004503 [Hyphomicrobiaceae bacterium]|jgi:hypothetical protein
MQLSNTRYIQIDGTRVALLAADGREARLALKELRHKKKELLHFKRRLRRRRKMIVARNKREARVGSAHDLSALAYIARSLSAVLHAISGWHPFPARALPTSLNAVNEDLNTLDDVLLNVSSAILHVEGKLLGG